MLDGEDNSVQPELLPLLKSDEVDEIRKKHPVFYEFLLSEKYIVPDDVREEEQIIEQWKSEENSPASFSVFVNPTLDCNMKCWYCYEKHRPSEGMGKEVFDSLRALLDDKMSDGRLVQFNLSFFGGEPLLEFDTVVMPLISYAEQLALKHGKRFSVNFVSNGILLDNSKIECLASVKTAEPVGFQITLDGDERYHNATKKALGCPDTYRTVLAVIRNLIAHRMPVTVRFNTTQYNVRSFHNVIPEFESLSDEERKFIRFDLQHVWQDANYDKKLFEDRLVALRETLVGKRFSVGELRRISPYRCYADRVNHIVVNYNGDLYKCTARDFIPENREGFLDKEGRVSWNDKFERRNSVKYGNAACRACRIFPLCHGRCSQLMLESDRSEGCMLHYSNEDKMKMIEDRVDFLLESIINQKLQNNEQKVKS